MDIFRVYNFDVLFYKYIFINIQIYKIYKYKYKIYKYIFISIYIYNKTTTIIKKVSGSQWLRLWASTVGAQVWSLAGELRSHMLSGQKINWKNFFKRQQPYHHPQMFFMHFINSSNVPSCLLAPHPQETTCFLLHYIRLQC